MKRSKRILALLLSMVLLFGMLPMSALAADSTFSDVKTSDWFYDDVRYVCENGLMNGTGSGTFSPKATTTRGMIVTILYRLSGEPAVSGVCPFGDVAAGKYYEKAITWAAENKIVSGYADGTFGPDNAITREQLAAILYRYATFCGYAVTASAEISRFADAGTVGSYALAAMKWASAEGLINGSGSKLDPKGSATRAQVAAILARFCKNIAGASTPASKPASSTGTVLPPAPNPTPDPDPTPGQSFTVTFDGNGENVQGVPPQQVVKQGEMMTVPAEPTCDGFYFAGWSTSKECNDLFNAYNEPINANISLFAYWVSEDSLGDTDGDGLADYLEIAKKTDINLQDTDGDGLTDYQEVMIFGYNPLEKDSDGNGISDYDEDYDQDGLSNGQEIELGTNPVVKDTDFDGLSDKDEIELYHTDPRIKDTDGDGADDGTEILYGTDPLVAQNEFTETSSSAPLSEDNPVSASVTASVDGSVLGSVRVSAVSMLDNPLLTENVPGYLGAAYDFNADGNIKSAVLEFSYDRSLGSIGDDFQPRIYYYNEKTQELEELPNQTVVDGKVSVSVEHFSTYILLNKIEFDDVWAADIKPPLFDGDDENAKLDIVFVIDYSASMDDNDPKQIFKALSKRFISKLRADTDQAAVVKFIKTATLVSALTTDKQQLNAAIDSISYDSGYNTNSGTDGSTGLHMALNELTQSESEYQYIIFITDGEDNRYTYSYDALIKSASENNAVVYTIGMGSASETVLKKIADGTNGKYYHATTEDFDTDNILNLDDVFEEIESNTIDLTTDTNGDGIPDYYNKLICDGSLPLSTGILSRFIGYDFTYDENGVLSDDYDGDGLKNGEELVIMQSGDKVFIKMISDPTMPDSDLDGYDDKKESILGMDPLKYSYDSIAADWIFTDGIFADYQLTDSYDNSIATAIAVNLTDVLSFNWTPVKACKQLCMDYFYDYANNTINVNAEENAKAIIAENTHDTLEAINKVIKAIKGGNKVVDKITEELDKLYILRSQLKTIQKRIAAAGTLGDEGRLDKLADDFIQINKQLEKYGVFKKISIKVTDFADKYQHLMNKKNFTRLSNAETIAVAASVFDTSVNIADTVKTYAKLNANTAAYMENLDIIAYLAENGDRKMVRDAANQIYGVFASGFKDYNVQLGFAVLHDILMGGTEYAVSKFVELNPYTKAAKAAYDVLDLLLGMSHKAECIDNSLCWESMIQAVKELALSTLVETRFSYDCKAADHLVSDRYLTHLAQLRIVGEQNFVDYAKNKGWITRFFDDGYEEAKQFCSSAIGRVWNSAGSLKLVLSPALPTTFLSSGGGSR